MSAAGGPAPRISLFGAPGSNTNLGLNALMHGTIAAVMEHEPDAHLAVFDNELGARTGQVLLADGRRASYTLVGARLSRRVTRPESFLNIRASLALGGLANPGARALRDSDLVLDVSGGDSFSDIYGEHRFRTVCAPKELALRARRPLVLLPQTYGPFRDPATARRARTLVLGAERAWARDPDSLEVLRQLLGADYDPSRHRLGVDLAMLLPASSSVDLPPDVEAALATGGAVGVNVSGLLWNAAADFGLRADYRVAVRDMVEGIVRGGHPVVLLPHVLGRRPGGEADNLADAELLTSLPAEVAAQVHRVPWVHTAADAKHVVSRCAFFVGTRMHSTIAALSSATPCAAIAYSSKYRGVFSSLGVADSVLDARTTGTADLTGGILKLVEDAPRLRRILEVTAAESVRSARAQMGEVLAARRTALSSAP